MRRLPAKYEPPAISQSAEETNDPLIADHRNFYKVEKWIKNGTKVTCCMPAGSGTKRLRSWPRHGE
jgi:hypothetical protein